MSEVGHRAAKTDVLVALFFGLLFCVSVFASVRSAADAVRRYGRNVDSGTVEAMVGAAYFAPVAVFFALAALAQWRGWRVGRPVHYVALLYVVAPLVLLIASEVRNAL